MAKMKSNGWHSQSVRHSNAKRFGKAGGIYSSARIKKLIKNNPEYKGLTYRQLQNKGVYLSYNGDADGDGVINGKDCRPLNKKLQDNGKPAPVEITIDNNDAPKETTLTPTSTPEPEKKLPIPKTPSKFRKNLEALGKTIKQKEQELEANFKEARAKSKERHLTELNSQLKNKIESEEEIDVKLLSDKELHNLAVLEGDSFFGGNKYEDELKRRVRENDRLNTDLVIERVESKLNQKDRLAEIKKEHQENKQGGSIFDEIFK